MPQYQLFLFSFFTVLYGTHQLSLGSGLAQKVSMNSSGATMYPPNLMCSTLISTSMTTGFGLPSTPLFFLPESWSWNTTLTYPPMKRGLWYINTMVDGMDTPIIVVLVLLH